MSDLGASVLGKGLAARCQVGQQQCITLPTGGSGAERAPLLQSNIPLMFLLVLGAVGGNGEKKVIVSKTREIYVH